MFESMATNSVNGDAEDIEKLKGMEQILDQFAKTIDDKKVCKNSDDRIALW